MLKDKTGCWHGDYISHRDFMSIETGNAVVCPNCLIQIGRGWDGRLTYREVAVATRVK